MLSSRNESFTESPILKGRVNSTRFVVNSTARDVSVRVLDSAMLCASRVVQSCRGMATVSKFAEIRERALLQHGRVKPAANESLLTGV